MRISVRCCVAMASKRPSTCEPMTSRDRTVLIDTNVIIASWRAGVWKALAGGCRMETVAEVFVESQTGFTGRSAEDRIDPDVLAADLAAVHPVGDAERAALALREPLAAHLDEGERMLWAHALARDDAWLLCGPDGASLRIGVRLGLAESLVSLEALLRAVGEKPRLPGNFTEEWHRRKIGEFKAMEGKW